jgi:hypothetical protein
VQRTLCPRGSGLTTISALLTTPAWDLRNKLSISVGGTILPFPEDCSRYNLAEFFDLEHNLKKDLFREIKLSQAF